MTCQECLAVLATGSLRDLTPDSPAMSHAATCPDCSRVSTQLRERESYAANLFNSLPSMSNPMTIAEIAVAMGRRRRKGRIIVMITGTALAVTIWIVAATTVIPALNRSDVRVASDLHTETIQLSCLSPKQAGDIISPYVRSHGSTFYLPSSGLSVITVRGTIKEIRKSRELISQLENDPSAACHLSPSVGEIVAPPTRVQAAPKLAP
jgi:hypothetical protein